MRSNAVFRGQSLQCDVNNYHGIQEKQRSKKSRERHESAAGRERIGKQGRKGAKVPCQEGA